MSHPTMKFLHVIIKKLEPFASMPTVSESFVNHPLKLADVPKRFHRDDFNVGTPSEGVPYASLRIRRLANFEEVPAFIK
jgi:hypothetical protein